MEPVHSLPLIVFADVFHMLCSVVYLKQGDCEIRPLVTQDDWPKHGTGLVFRKLQSFKMVPT